MIRFIAIFLPFVMSQHLLLKVTGDPECSTVGIRGLLVASANHLARLVMLVELKKTGLNIANYVPSGLKRFGHNPSGKRNLAYLCEDNTVAILHQ